MKEEDTVLITGATGLIGTAICRYLLGKGWCVVLASRELRKAKASLNRLEASAKCHAVEMDIRSEGSISTALSNLQQDGIKISHLINNARDLSNLEVNDNGQTSVENFIQEFDIGVSSPYNLIIKLVDSNYHGLTSIVNVSSQYGIVAANKKLYENLAEELPINYGVVKAALNHMTKELAVRLAERKIRVNAIAFGGFVGRSTPDFEKRYSEFLPLGRMLTLDEAGPPIDFLLDNQKSSSITGHVLVADGGWSAV